MCVCEWCAAVYRGENIVGLGLLLMWAVDMRQKCGIAAGDNRRAGKVLLPGDHYSIRRVLLLGSDLPKQVASSPFSRGEV